MLATPLLSRPLTEGHKLDGFSLGRAEIIPRSVLEQAPSSIFPVKSVQGFINRACRVRGGRGHAKYLQKQKVGT